MRALIRSTFLAAAISLVVGSAAFATTADREPLPTPGPWLYPAGTACAFDMLLSVPLNREHTITITYADGSSRVIVQGDATLETTNLETGKTLDWNASGPAMWVYGADGNLTTFMVMGHQFPGGDPDLFQWYAFEGLINFETGIVAGRFTDVCALLSA